MALDATGPDRSQAGRAAARPFQQAIEGGPDHLLAGLNLAEALTLAGQTEMAADRALRTLLLAESPSKAEHTWLQDAHFPPEFDLFRTEWERAAWASASPVEEAAAKRQLIRWRLHALLGQVTGDLEHLRQAAGLRPDLAPTQVALGAALLQRGKVEEAVAHLEQAVAANPLDRTAPRELFAALGALGRKEAQFDLAARRRLLCCCAPEVVTPEAWFASRPESTERQGQQTPAGQDRPPRSARPAGQPRLSVPDRPQRGRKLARVSGPHRWPVL